MASFALRLALLKRGVALDVCHRVACTGQRILDRAQSLRFSTTPSATVAVPAALVKQLRELTGAPMIDCKAALQVEGNDVNKAVDLLRKKGIATASKKAGRTAAQGLVAVKMSADGADAAIIELNCETDFVARNASFQLLASRIATAALSVLPSSSCTVTSGLRASEAEGAATSLTSAQLPGGDGTGKDCTIAAGVTDTVAAIRENMVLRRASRLNVPGGLIVSYTHNAVSPGLGSIGVLLGLAPAKAGGVLPRGNAALQDLARRVAMHVAAAKPLYCVRSDVPPSALERERSIQAELAKSQGSGKSEAIVAKMVEGRLGKFYGDSVLGEQPFILGEDGVKVGKLVETVSAAAGVHARLAAFVHFAVGEGAPGTAAEEGVKA